jgi:prepilin signal peptidase PulO-like enzyme (type II secretory pathway)
MSHVFSDAGRPSVTSDALLLDVLLGLLGLLVGAAIVYVAPRLVAYRLPEPIEFPTLKALIPIAGGWSGRGRPLSRIAVEVATVIIFVALAIHFGRHIQLALAALYSTLLVLIAYIDIDYRLVLNRLSYPGVLLAVAASTLWPGIGPKYSLLGAVVALVIFTVLQLVGRGKLGMGDTKLATLIGAMTGIFGVFNALLIGVLLGAAAALILLVVLRRGRKSYFAYAPYLAAGAILSFFVSQ